MTPPDLDAIYRAHGPQLLAVAVQLTGDHQLAEDALHEAFVAAHKGLAKFRGESTAETWLYRIVIRSAGALREKRWRDAARERKLGQRETKQSTSADDASALRAAIEKLPDELRLVVVLMNLRELSAHTVGEILGIPEGTVWSRASRARRVLADTQRPAAAEAAHEATPT